MKNLNIRTRLLLSFGIGVLLTILISGVSVAELRKISREFEIYIEQTQAAGDALKESQISMTMIARYIRDVQLENERDRIDQYVEAISQKEDSLQEEMETLRKIQSDGETEEYEQAVSEWMGVGERIVKAIQDGDTETAKELTLNECTPSLDRANEISIRLSEELEARREQLLKENDEVMKVAVITVAVVATAAILFAVFMGLKVTASIVRPLGEMEYAMQRMARGDLHQTISYQGNDEVGSLAQSFRAISGFLSQSVSGIVTIMDEMAHGRFSETIENEQLYLGDFEPLVGSVKKVNKDLGEVLSEVREISERVAQHSGQVADGAQTMSQGSVEQAGAVQELSATLSEVSGRVNEMAQNAASASGQVEAIRRQLGKSSVSMEEMMTAMQEIDQKSADIGKIIKTIEDIAFQTNILALNAAVEAARAGTAGKGFAVVADEVRSLASRSADAAGETTELIRSMLEAVQRGNGIAGETAGAMDEAVKKTESTVMFVEQISHAAQEEAQAVSQIREGVEQVSGVVQINSATAQESAAVSEELASQAQILKNTVERFRSSEPSARPKGHCVAGNESYKRKTVRKREPVTYYRITEDLRTGNELIDSEHSQLFEVINQLLQACQYGEGRDNLQNTVEFLESYVKRHFSDEEELQRNSGYPEDQQHRKYHEAYKKIIRQIREELMQEGATVRMLNKVNTSIGEWLTVHIKKEDMKLAEYLRKKNR